MRGGHFRLPPDSKPIPKERRGRTIRRIAAFFRPYRGQVAVVTAAILLTSLLGLINPILLKLLIDDAIPHLDWGRLNLYVGLMILVPIVSGLIGVGQSYLNNSIGQNVMQDLRGALYAHLQRMPLRFFTETKTGEIQSRLANDVGGVQGVVTDTAASVASNLAVVIGTIVAMVIIDWRLTALSLGMLPFFMYLTYRVGKIRRTISTDTQEALAALSATTQETLSVSGILLTKTFGQQAAANARFAGQSRKLAVLQIRSAMVGRWFFMIVGTIFSITPAFVYWLAGFLAINHDPSAPTIGDIVAFTTLQSRLFFPMGQLLSIQVEIQGALALFDRIFEYLEMDPVIVDAPDAIDLAAGEVQGRVRLRDVSFRYPAQAPIMRGAAQPSDAAAMADAVPNLAAEAMAPEL
ncbi:MAG TPA: ABC transporter ATP-binding protein, partial [Candidatus Limnocylindrales bacterium]|nr:ABC transporter ATP-binding protein [Candidatus Limnocylindrales bacterium]